MYLKNKLSWLSYHHKFSTTMGLAANSWLAIMDKYLTLDVNDPLRTKMWSNIQSLVDTYYQAVDAEKSGKQVCQSTLQLIP